MTDTNTTDASNDEVIERNFEDRTPEDQEAFLTQTWCNACQAADLGMVEPKEYLLNDAIIVEGKCKKCGEVSLTEVADESTDGEWEDEK
ncbi:MAG: hypothetical protein JKY50_17995 [Oleispira sp.]|nr:hypothetical protein [Oleispira sp.]